MTALHNKNVFFKYGPIPASFCLVSFFSNSNKIAIVQFEKSVDGVLGIQTRGCRMVGEDETTELWRYPTHTIRMFKTNMGRVNSH